MTMGHVISLVFSVSHSGLGISRLIDVSARDEKHDEFAMVGVRSWLPDGCVTLKDPIVDRRPSRQVYHD